MLLAERAKLQRLLAGIAFDSSVKHDESAAGEIMKGMFWLVLALGAGYWLYTDWQASGSLTGKAFYEACWERVSDFTKRPNPCGRKPCWYS
ncbi:hypothetical protein [Bradyrhizobium vignae]|uniref:hypothetical protein n=1 Tax=Bradyrhizobium vignae TaxID=1549949 RepID=UPI000EFF8599|nr:hypothetical protein [Bradyrhizobium vignae]RXG87834.1 hypothetical protein EAV90_31475 [Bradyrhizobium vignae]